MFCPRCGKPIPDSSKFCPECGAATVSAGFASKEGSADTLLLQLSQKENTAGIIWIVIGALQIFTGIVLYWPALILGIYNIFAATTRFQQSKRVCTPYLSLVDDYQKWQTALIISLITNIILGALVGVIGIIYDFTIRNFVMMHQAELREHAARALSEHSQPTGGTAKPAGPENHDSTQFALVVSMKKQVFIVPPKVTVKIHNTITEIISQEKPHTFYLAPGRYQIEFTSSIRKTLIELDLSGNVSIEVSFNKAMGYIDVVSSCEHKRITRR